MSVLGRRSPGLLGGTFIGRAGRDGTMADGSGHFDPLRRPEYTGENRCVPCTAVNLVAAVTLAIAVSIVLPSGIGPTAGATVFAASAAAIYLRGYLVPGTPWFTRTYFPDWLLGWFDKETAAGTAQQDPVATVNIEGTLRRWDALQECAAVDDLCLTPDFHDAWRDRIAVLREEDTSRADLAAILGTDADGLSFREFGSAFVATEGHRRVGQWESRAAFLADVAGGRVLAERVEDWAEFGTRQRGALLAGLRLFLEQCPICEGPVAVDEEGKRSCCRSFEVVAATCSACGARLFEAELRDAA